MEGRKDGATFQLHLTRCLFCAQCARSCPREAIELTPDFELATTERERLVLHFDRACQEA
jgi:formate hydrogenlyase subunit 6/NADH:ubiquinone oxidoreductase subunit I